MIAAAVFVSLRLQNSRVGRAWMAIREDEIAAAAMGINHVAYKLLAFAMGAAFGGHDRRLLRLEAADGDAGHVHVPGLRHDSRHDRAGRHGLVRGVVLAAIILPLLQSGSSRI